MGQETSPAPTAEGDLTRTPLAHLLLYAIEQQISGALFLSDPITGVNHVVRFVRGVPVKVRPGDGYAFLGELLVETGAIAPDVLVTALLAQDRLGEVLVRGGHVTQETIDRTLELQFRRRMVRLFALPASTQYKYFENHNELAEWGKDTNGDPLALLWSGVRAHGEISTQMQPILERLAGKPLRLHVRAAPEQFGLSPDEQELVAAMASGAEPVTLETLTAKHEASKEVLRRLIYTLFIARHLDLGVGMPIGIAAGPEGRQPVVTPFHVGKMQLRSTVHRVGAAAPDPPGDGERAAVVPRTRKKERPLLSSEPEIVIEEVNGSAEVAIDSPSTSGPQPTVAAPIDEFEGVVDPTKSPRDLLNQAETSLRDRDIAIARRCWELATRADPTLPDAVAIGAWLQSLLPGADVKALSLPLDDLLREDAPHVRARFVRGILRKRMGDDAGAMRDLKRVIEIDPAHGDAARELAALEERHNRPSAPPGLLARLFRR